MRKEQRKPRLRRGETLTEVLVALLVVSLSIVLLTGMVNASMSINARMRQADGGDDGFYPALSDTETHEFDHHTDDPVTVRLTGGPTTLTLDDVYAYSSAGQSGLVVYGKEG